MIYKVEYTHWAITELKDTIQYIIDEFGFSKGQDVRNEFRKIIAQIAKNPYLFPFFDRKKNIRKLF